MLLFLNNSRECPRLLARSRGIKRKAISLPVLAKIMILTDDLTTSFAGVPPVPLADALPAVRPDEAPQDGEYSEIYRLAVLRSYGLLDSPADATFDALTSMAARLFGVPTVLISLMDEERQWFKSRVGFDVCETARDISFCRVIIEEDAPLVVPDARADARFAANPLVTGAPHVRFYAGAPLRAPEGVTLGTLCLLDTQPREFSEQDSAQLAELAELIVKWMKLQHNERLYRSLVESSADLVTVFDTLGNVTYQSPAFARQFGYDLDGFGLEEMLDLVHADDRDGVMDRYATMLEGKCGVGLHRFRFLHGDGSWRILETYGRYELDNPEIGGIVSVSRDVTNSAHMEEQLSHSEHLFAATFEQSSLGMALVALDGALLRINPAFSQMTGIERERISEHHYSEIMAPDAVAASTENAQKLVDGEMKSLSLERPLFHQNGESRWAQFNVSRVEDEIRGDYLLVQVQDIEERRQRNERLRLLESVAVNANDAILITAAEPIEEEEDGPRILYANEAYVKMSGYTLEEILGKTPRIMQGAGTDPATREQIRKSLKRWKPIVVEILNYSKTGQEFWVELSIVPIADEKGWYTHWVSVQRDITARKESEAILIRTRDEADRAREEAEDANAAKSEFLSRMSHELRTPLNAILGFGQLLELEEQNENNRESTEQILKAGRHLLELINEVLDISRIETGRMAMSLETVSVAEVARETLDLVRAMAAQSGISLRAEALFSSPITVVGDRRRVKQVLLNVVSNAIKYNHAGGSVTLSLEAVAANADEGECERVRLCVTDTGIGIAPEKRERLWVPFDRLDAETTGVEGTGIGLALSHRLAQAMNGRLDVRGETQGSTFWLELPRAASLPTLSDADLSGIIPATSPAVSTRWVALYIDDNLPNVQLVQGILARRPEVRLLTALQGALGLELAQQHCPDIILLDLHLPDINGDEILRRLRENPATRNIPVVMISADATPGQTERLLRAGANDYLSKPFDIGHFLRVLDSCIALPAEPQAQAAV